jgi:hypothetical protein
VVTALALPVHCLLGLLHLALLLLLLSWCARWLWLRVLLLLAS